MNAEKALENLSRNGFDAKYFGTAAQAERQPGSLLLPGCPSVSKSSVLTRSEAV